MTSDEIRRRSRWMIRALEWNDPKARYPNLWHEGMPVQIMAFDTIAMRIRLGDLLASYHPASQRHAKRAGKFLGISRVVGLRRAHAAGYSWIDLETAHRFRAPLDLGTAPRRVFLCCDPGWPEPDAGLFQRVFDAAVAEGWKPTPEEAAGGEPLPPAAAETVEPETSSEEPAPAVAAAEPAPAYVSEPVEDEETATGKLFGGVAFGSDMRDPRDGTWLALLRLVDDRLRLVRLDATGRHGLQTFLRDPDRALMNAEAIGMDFPFSLPEPFAETLLGGKFPDEGWWGLARHIERMNYPDYLIALQEYRESNGEIKRFTDERTGSPSPLHRESRDLGSLLFHGVRMIAEERSRYVVRPFESAQGRLLLEVDPAALLRSLGESPPHGADATLEAVHGLETLPIDVPPVFVPRLRGRREALEAVLSARCAAAAVVSGEAEKAAEDLAADAADKVRREGWIYGA